MNKLNINLKTITNSNNDNEITIINNKKMIMKMIIKNPV